MKTGLKNCWVIITGASRGIGQTMARKFAQEGAHLILVARSAAGLEDTMTQLRPFNVKVHAIAFDLADIEGMEELVRKIHEITPHVDILVNNAGLEKYGFFDKYRREDILSILSVNLIAPMELTRLLLPGMLARKQGHIINIGSMAGRIGEIYNSLYDASKGGMELWTDALRQEVYKTGVKVSTINPGGVRDTGMIHNIGVNYPVAVGSCTSDQVADAVVRCTYRYKSRVFVNSMPVRPIAAFSLFFPQAMDAFMRLIGVRDRNRQKAEKRMQADQKLARKSPA